MFQGLIASEYRDMGRDFLLRAPEIIYSPIQNMTSKLDNNLTFGFQ